MDSTIEAAVQTFFGRRASQALESLLDEALNHEGRRVPIPKLRRMKRVLFVRQTMEDGGVSAAALLQLKQQLSQLSEKERVEMSAFLHRMKQETPAWQKEMSRRMAEMDAGKKIHLPKPLAKR